MITVFGRPNSSNVQRVIWLLVELGLDFETVVVGGSFGGTNTPEYRAMNPTGLVPSLRDGDRTLWESEAIMRYLAAGYGSGGPFWPEYPADRVLTDSWLGWLSISMKGPMDAVFYRTTRKPKAEQDPADLAPHAALLTERFAFVDAGLADRAYLAGDAFGLADIPAAIWAHRYFEMPIERPEQPRLAAWLARVAERPGFRDHVATMPIAACLEDWVAHERTLG